MKPIDAEIIEAMRKLAFTNDQAGFRKYALSLKEAGISQKRVFELALELYNTVNPNVHRVASDFLSEWIASEDELTPKRDDPPREHLASFKDSFYHFDQALATLELFREVLKAVGIGCRVIGFHGELHIDVPKGMGRAAKEVLKSDERLQGREIEWAPDDAE
jgi:hypothetical protein